MAVRMPERITIRPTFLAKHLIALVADGGDGTVSSTVKALVVIALDGIGVDMGDVRQEIKALAAERLDTRLVVELDDLVLRLKVAAPDRPRSVPFISTPAPLARPPAEPDNDDPFSGIAVDV